MGPEMLFFICFMGIFLIYILLGLRAQNKKIEQMSKRVLLLDQGVYFNEICYFKYDKNYLETLKEKINGKQKS